MPLNVHCPVLALPQLVHRFPVQGLTIETLNEKLACLQQSIVIKGQTPMQISGKLMLRRTM
jgi:hypothetical protein